MFAPIDESLDVTAPAASAPLASAERISSRRAFHTVKSRNPRLKGWLWLLPGRRELAIGALVLAAVAVFVLGGRPLEVTETDRRVLPSAAYVARLGGTVAVPGDAGKWEKRRAWGGGVELEYNYVPEVDGQPGVRSLAWVDDTEAEAKETFRRLALNTVFDWGLGREEPVGLVWLDEHDPIGDESRLYRVEVEREVLGHSIAVRRGTRTVYAKIAGDVLDDGQARSLARELLANLGAIETP